MRLIVVEFMTLDGVMEAPGFEEHRTGRNGWAMDVGDQELQAFSGEQIKAADALLFGRTTYNIWAAFWPTAPEVAATMGVHIASRVMSTAGDGQVVVTRTVRDLATGTDLEFAPLGAVALRGVPGEWELFGAKLR